jgi:hypothetical protein
MALLDEGLRQIADKCRADETKKMVNAIEVGCLWYRTGDKATNADG